MPDAAKTGTTIMGLKKRISSGLKQAMKDRDTVRLSTLRLINAAVKDSEIELRSREEGARRELSDSEVLSLLTKKVKQRHDSARAYEEGGRLELAEKENAEIGVIEEFLPARLSETEQAKAIDAAISGAGAESLRDMGKVMAVLKQNYAGQMDFGVAGPMVKERLSKG